MDVVTVTPSDSLPVLVYKDGVVEPRLRIDDTTFVYQSAGQDRVPLVIRDSKLEPPLIRIIRSTRERMTHPAIPDDHIDLNFVARLDHRGRSIEWCHEFIESFSTSQSQHIDTQFFVTHKPLDPLDRFMISSDKRERRIHGRKPM
jgi:hypothetical protein